MVSALPKDQLLDLCTGEGATPLKIRQQAPFLKSLPATRHAMQVLPNPSGMVTWSDAARSLLVCVTRPGGAAGFDQHTSQFVVAGLALDGSTNSLSQRLHNLVALSDDRYPTSKTTWRKLRVIAMENLASVLVTLEKYPCVTHDRLSKIARLVAAQTALIRDHLAPNLSAGELLELHRLIFEEIPRAKAYYDQEEFSTPLSLRLGLIAQKLSEGAYLRLFEDLGPHAVNLLVPPEYLSALYLGIRIPYDLNSEEVESTTHAVSLIMVDTQEHNLWRETLSGSNQPDFADRLIAQRRRIVAYFESRSDVYY